MVEKIYEESIRDVPWLARMRHKYREPLAEFFGTFVMAVMGINCNIVVIVGGGIYGGWSQINWGWGVAVMMGVYCCGGISGAHLNPAVTLAMCVYRKFPWKKLPMYFCCHFMACFLGALVAYGNSKSGIDSKVGSARDVLGPNATAAVFGTYPQEFMEPVGSFFSEVITTGILVIGIFAINDNNNLPAGHLGPIVILFLLYGIGACLGWNTGYVINPARDLGPRLASYIVGYGSGVWTAHHHYAWSPIVAPCTGAVFGGFLYDFFVYTGTESPLNQPYIGLRGTIIKVEDEEIGNVKGDHLIPGTAHGGHTHHPALENVLLDDAGREVIVEYHQKRSFEVSHVENASNSNSNEKVHLD